MSRRAITAFLLAFILIQASAFAKTPVPQTANRVTTVEARKINVAPSLATADTCIVRNDEGETSGLFYYPNWVIGNELYKNYLDPSLSCDSAYPYTISEVHMFLYYFAPSEDTFSVDIELPDPAGPNCYLPGELVTVSSAYAVPIGEAGLWDVVIPLDTPVSVDGPFFAGFFIHNQVDTLVGPTVITDSVLSPEACISYNIWDADTGWVDLATRGFIGRLVMFVSGVPGGGGSSTDPRPGIRFVAPQSDTVLFGPLTLWVEDTTGVGVVDYVSFQYAPRNGSFVEIGQDHDGFTPLRNGLDYSGSGDGFTIDWDTSPIDEDFYTLRAVAYDTAGRSEVIDIGNIYIEPTPPTPKITSPANGAEFCNDVNLLMTTDDEDLSFMDIFRYDAQLDYSAGLTTLDQNTLGDSNGNPADGNHAYNGEFGDYYCAPVASAIVLKLWYDRGYFALMSDGGATFGIDTLAEKLAVEFRTRENLGTYDEDLFFGLRKYIAEHGHQVQMHFERNPDYYLLRNWVENEERSVMIALGGTPGVWLAVDGFRGWQQRDGSFYITASVPATGTKIDLPIRNNASTCEVLHNITWQRVDLMVSVVAKGWTVSRTILGTDNDGSDGWSFDWTPSGLAEDNLYFFHTQGKDAIGLYSSSAILMTYNCSQVFTPGDYNSDGLADIYDLLTLQDYITRKGIPPSGGEYRADANGDNSINLADIVYYINFLFGSTLPPHY
jgi:hypothetical protein